MRIEDLLNQVIKPEPRRHEAPKYTPIQDKPTRDIYESNMQEFKKNKKQTKEFENWVLVYLFDNAKRLGIEKIYHLENMRVDGLLKLDNGKTILLETKFALNWKTASNAKVELQLFFEGDYKGKPFREYIPENLPEEALIIFNHFTGDWRRGANNRKRLNGWNFFYEDEEILGGKFPIVPIHIAQLTEGILKGAPKLDSE